MCPNCENRQVTVVFEPPSNAQVGVNGVDRREELHRPTAFECSLRVVSREMTRRLGQGTR